MDRTENIINGLKEKTCYYMKTRAMTLEELELERDRLKNLISDYETYGTAQSINTEKYHHILKLIRSYSPKN